MVNPGAFSGSRRDFLAAQADLYSTAVTENHVADTVADIQRRYFKRYPISLPHNEEPSAEWVANVDDNAPDEDLLPPDETQLTGTALEAAQTVYDDQVKLLKFRKEQIARRLNYQHTKAKAPAKHVDVGSSDPIAIMQAKLTGVSLKKPRLRLAWNVWGQKNRQFVDAIYEERIKTENIPQTQRAALRARIYKECFEELEEDERKEYEKQAIDEHKSALAKIEAALNGPPSEDPVDRQRVLTGLPNFVQPILDLITQHSGWKATLLVGGPEPADNGRLNIMSFHSGETSGSVKMNFGRCERRAYKEYVTPIFGTFLKKCYTVEECRAAALSDPHSVSLAEALHLDGGGYTIDSADDAVNFVKIARTPGARTASGSSNDPDMPSTPLPPATYEIPPRIGPPIHSKKVRPTAAGSQAEPMSITQTTQEDTVSAVVSELDPSTRVCHQSPCGSVAPSPAPTPCASPMATPHTAAVELPLCTSLACADLPTSKPTPPLREAATPCPSSLHSPPVQAPHNTSKSISSNRASLGNESPSCRAASLLSPEQELEVDVVRPDLEQEQPVRASVPSPTVPGPQKRRRRDKNAVEENGIMSGTDIDGPRKRLRSSKTGVAAGGHVAGTSSTLSRTSVPPPLVGTEQSTIAFATRPHTTQSTAPLTPEQLSAAPNWFLPIYQMLVSTDLGPGWAQLVRTWAHFEKSEGYEEQGKLSSTGRPSCISSWIKYARSAKFRPNIGPLPLFDETFNAWWVSLQPAWRVDAGPGGGLRRQAGDLTDLRRPGKNGLLSVLAALFFWGINAQAQDGIEYNERWKLAVDDVHWVIHHLASE